MKKTLYPHKTINASLPIIAGLIFVFATANVAQAISIYSEDFEGAGTTLEDFGYVSQGFLKTALAVDTTSNLGTRGQVPGTGAHWKVPLSNAIPTFDTEPILRFSIDLNMNGGDTWYGLNTGKCCNNEGIHVGAVSGNQWGVDLRGLPSHPTDQLGFGTNSGFGANVTAQVEVNSTTNELRVLITDRSDVTAIHAEQTITGLTADDLAAISALDHFAMQNAASTLSGAEADNIVVDNNAISAPAGPPPMNFSWTVNSSGDWNSASNWAPSVGPPGASDSAEPFSSHQTATFGGTISENRTVFTDRAVNVRSILFDNTNSYAIAGHGNVNLIATTAAGQSTQISVAQGSHQFQAIVELATDTSVDIASGSSLEFNNRLLLNGHTLIKTGEGTLAVSNDVVSGGGTINLSQGTLEGNGSVGGDVLNDGGIVSPGNNGVQSASAVPEPTTWLMLVMGMLGCQVLLRNRR